MERLVVEEIRGVLADQRALLAEQLDELRHHVRLAIAVLAGSIAALGLIGNAGWHASTSAAILLGAGIAMALATGIAGTWAASGGRGHTQLALGPDPEALAEGLRDPSFTQRELHVGLASAGARQFSASQQRMQRVAGSAGWTAALLIAGVVLIALGLVLIVGGAILWT